MNRSGILVIAEIDGGELSALTSETLGLARRLGDCAGCGVTALVLDKRPGDVGSDMLHRGADRVLLIENPEFGQYQAQAWLPDIVEVVRSVAPEIILVGHSMIGMDLAPRLAFRLETAVAMACVEVAPEDGKLLFTRNCFGGKAREVSSFRTAPIVATIYPKTQKALAPDPSRSGEITDVRSVLDAGSVKTRIVERTRGQNASAALETARVVVAGGGGMKGPDGFHAAEALAGALGGAVGASRLACDLGWCPPDLQIGLSGRTVAPDVYFAVGISGAVQHLAGCANSGVIVAINSDGDAPIFSSSRFGIVGDCHEIMPALTAAIVEIKD